MTWTRLTRGHRCEQVCVGGREEVVVHNVTLHDLDSASARP